MDAKGVKCELEDLTKDNLVLPAIAYVTVDQSYNHYVVIYEINFNKKTILIADPANKIKKFHLQNLVKCGTM